MRSALYYPHTEIQSESLIRSALLTWDKLEYIVPFKEYRPHYDDKSIAEAMELIGAPRAPSKDDQQQMHKLLVDLVETGIPETFRYARGRDDGPVGRRGQRHYELYPQKLLRHTWDKLMDHEVIGDLLENGDYPTTEASGLTIMAMLADVMAGETRARVTDRGFAYATIANVANVSPASKHRAQDIAEVVPLTFKTIALDAVELDRLVAFRRREAKDRNGHQYRALRHNYLKRLEDHLAKVVNHKLGSKDRDELDRAFEEDMEDDLRDLKDELGMAKTDAILSKETVTFVLAGLGGAAVLIGGAHTAVPEALTMAGTPATIGGLLGVASKFGSKRRDVLRKHPMAYLYEIGG